MPSPWSLMQPPTQWMPTQPPLDKAAYGELLTTMAAKAGIVPLAVIDEADGKAKGHLWIMEIRPEHGVFEVGFITYSPSLQRTRTATEAIYLVGDYGFSHGYRRYEWKCNNRNEPSKRAAQRFGFTIPRAENHLDTGINPAQGNEGLRTIHPWHLHVKQDQIDGGLMNAIELDGFIPIGGK